MLTLRNTLAAALCALSGTLLGSAAQATAPSFTFTLDNGGVLTITQPASGTVTGNLLGTVTNLTNSTLTFTNYSVNGTFDAASDYLAHQFPNPALTSLAPLATFHGDLADFIVSSTTPLGLYDLNGGSTATNTVSLTANGLTIAPVYSVNVVPGAAPAVPEPSSWAVLGVGVFGLGALILRRKAVRS